MENKIIKWGIIGLGKIATKFATDLATVENAELVAVASRSEGRATDFGKKFGLDCVQKRSGLASKRFEKIEKHEYSAKSCSSKYIHRKSMFRDREYMQ